VNNEDDDGYIPDSENTIVFFDDIIVLHNLDLREEHITEQKTKCS